MTLLLLRLFYTVATTISAVCLMRRCGCSKWQPVGCHAQLSVYVASKVSSGVLDLRSSRTISQAGTPWTWSEDYLPDGVTSYRRGGSSTYYVSRSKIIGQQMYLPSRLFDLGVVVPHILL